MGWFNHQLYKRFNTSIKKVPESLAEVTHQKPTGDKHLLGGSYSLWRSFRCPGQCWRRSYLGVKSERVGGWWRMDCWWIPSSFLVGFYHGKSLQILTSSLKKMVILYYVQLNIISYNIYPPISKKKKQLYNISNEFVFSKSPFCFVWVDFEISRMTWTPQVFFHLDVIRRKVLLIWGDAFTGSNIHVPSDADIVSGHADDMARARPGNEVKRWTGGMTLLWQHSWWCVGWVTFFFDGHGIFVKSDLTTCLKWWEFSMGLLTLGWIPNGWVARW